MSQETYGGMTAVLGLSEDKIAEILNENGHIKAYKLLTITNTPFQIIISGTQKDIDRLS